MTVSDPTWPERMGGTGKDGDWVPTEADVDQFLENWGGKPEQRAEAFQILFIGRFRQQVRAALWPVWPNNLGVGDQEILDAIYRTVNELVRRRATEEGGCEATMINKATLTRELGDWHD